MNIFPQEENEIFSSKLLYGFAMYKTTLDEKNGIRKNFKQRLYNIVIIMPGTYLSYFNTYGEFHVIRNFVDQFENLFSIGRNDMHRYNNQDHSMLSAMTSVENIIKDVKSKDNIWAINIEEEYHENKYTNRWKN